MTPPAKGERLRSRLNRPAAVDPDAPAPPPTETVSAPKPGSGHPELAPEPEEPTPGADDEKPTTAVPAMSSAHRPTRRTGTEPAEAKLNAVEDPDCIPGEKDYRSFYLEDTAYFRYRAAIYWASRNPDAADEVPENMTAGVEDFMIAVAGELELRFNAGEPFRMPPATKRRGRTTRRRRNTGP